MSDPFSIGVGDYQRAFFYQTEPVIDGTGQTVKFSLYNLTTKTLQVDKRAAQFANGTYLIDGASTDLTLASGVLLYVPSAPDFDVAGVCIGWFTLTDGSSKPLTIPGDSRRLPIHIVPPPPASLAF